MKKSLTQAVHLKLICCSQSFKIMRNTLLLLLLCVFQVFAGTSYSQATRLTMDLQDVTVKEVLSQIEENSEFFFLYNTKLIDVNRRVSVKTDNELIEPILSHLFKEDRVAHIIVDRQIILSPQNLAKHNLLLPMIQQQPVTGKVTDSDGNPLTGVNIVVKGTVVGTITDIDGNYSINVPPDGILVFSFVGMQTKEIPVEGRNSINVDMEEGATGLGEVVVVGYGTQKKINLTGSVASVTEDELVKQSVTSAAQAIQGRVTGVEVIRNNGAPGAGAVIRIRGLGTFGNTTPLVIIDGIEGDINLISPNEIESINILKDASSAAIYGARAANGVILVTTKRGQSGRTMVQYNMNAGFSQPVRIPGYLNAQEFSILWNEALVSANQTPFYTNEEIAAFGEGTDWVRAVLQNGFRQNHNLQFSGGTQHLRYALSADYLDETGIVINSWYKRYNVRLNLESDVTKWLTIGTNNFVSHSKQHETPYYGYETPLVVYALEYTPTISPKVGGMEGTGGPNHNAPNESEYWAMDPVTYSNFYSGNRNYFPKYTLTSSFFADFRIAEGLHFRTTLGMNKYFANNKVFYPSYTYYDSLGEDGGGSIVSERLPQDRYLTQTSYDNIAYTFTNLLTYTRTFDEAHHLTVLLGHNDQKYVDKNFTAVAYNFPSNDLQMLSLGTERQNVGENANHWALRSYFGRLNYDYLGRYLVEFSVRRDASSRFAEKYRWGTFPSGSVGWRISDESFMSDVDWIDDLKVRASYGVLGGQDFGEFSWNSSEMVRTNFDLSAQPIGLYEHYATMNLGTSYPFNHVYNTGASVTSYANPEIKWEVAKITNIGLDMTILRGSLVVNAEYFIKNTTDLILPVQLPATTGIINGSLLGSYYGNVGEMKNTGFEYALHYFKRSGDFRFDIRYTGTHLHNEIVKLQEGIDSYFLDANYAHQHKIGAPYGAVSGFNIIGVYQTQEEVDARLATIQERGAVAPGDYIYDDTNGDGIVDGEDVIVLGSPLPTYIFGLTANASYKGFDMNIHVQGDLGKVIHTSTRGRFNFSYYTYLNNFDYVLDRWTGPGSTNESARLVASSINELSNSHPTRVQDASYAKIRHIELGYTIPARFTSRIGVQHLRVFGNVANLACFTNYIGFEVEKTGSYQRTDITPQARTISFGATVQF